MRELSIPARLVLDHQQVWLRRPFGQPPVKTGLCVGPHDAGHLDYSRFQVSALSIPIDTDEEVTIKVIDPIKDPQYFQPLGAMGALGAKV